jgi:hypothetical protein
MSDDYDDFDGGHSSSSSEHEVGFFDDTEGALVAGRRGDMGGITRAALGKLKVAVEALGKEKGLADFTLVPSGDLTNTGPGADEDCWGSFVVGILHGSGGGYAPDPVTREKCLGRLAALAAIGDDVWKAVEAMLPERSSLEEPGMYVVHVGPLASASIVFGKQGTEEDAGQGEYFRGQDMSQEPHPVGVWGQRVASGEDPALIDFSESAHQARVAAFPEGGYYLIARYD